MSDVQVLFAILVALYLWECACWLRRDSVAFTTWLGKSWKRLEPGTLVGNQRGGFVLVSPWPPLGTFIVLNQLPCTLTDEGVLFFVASNINPGWRAVHGGQYLKFADRFEACAKGKRLLVNGTVVLSATSPGYAAYMAELLQAVHAAKAQHRTRVIRDRIASALDVRAFSKRWSEVLTWERPICRLANVLFFHLFAVSPVLIGQLGFTLAWPWLLAGMLVLTVSIAVRFRRAHKHLFPALEDERFTFSLIVALVPTSALRAHDLLTRHACESYHPLVAANCLLSGQDFESFARWVLRDLRYPMRPLSPGLTHEAEAAEQSGRAALLAVVEDFLRRNGADPKTLCRAPRRTEGCFAYCPRCEAQFISAQAVCSDCGGLELTAFESGANS